MIYESSVRKWDAIFTFVGIILIVGSILYGIAEWAAMDDFYVDIPKIVAFKTVATPIIFGGVTGLILMAGGKVMILLYEIKQALAQENRSI